MWKTIIQVGGEGGGITLKGMRLKDQTWLFTRVRDDPTLTEFLDGEDLDTLRPLLKGQSKVVSGFEKGIQLLNDAWQHLYPKSVHPEFREAVWNMVSNSDIRSFRLSDWAEVCFPDRSEASRRYREARNSK